jgi:hypothetical protein
MKTAAMIQTGVGYRSGVLFAKLAEAIACMATDSRDAVIQLLRTVEEITTELSVYHFIQLPLQIYLKDEIILESLKQRIEWLDFNAARSTCEQAIQRALLTMEFNTSP